MIASIEGTLVEILDDGVLVEVGGMGYQVLVPASSIATLPPRGDRVRLHTHLHVREDALTLYGFATAEQRDLFRILLGVAGIGPKGAVAVLAVYQPAAFRKAVLTEDRDALTLVPGVGKKTAARMILELREKLGLPDLDTIPGETSGRAELAEVRSALLSLGYSAAEAREALQRIDPDDAPVEELLKRALRELGRGAAREGAR